MQTQKKRPRLGGGPRTSHWKHKKALLRRAWPFEKEKTSSGTTGFGLLFPLPIDFFWGGTFILAHCVFLPFRVAEELRKAMGSGGCFWMCFCCLKFGLVWLALKGSFFGFMFAFFFTVVPERNLPAKSLRTLPVSAR